MIDTFYRPGKEIDSHDFKLTANGDMMYLPVHNITMDLRQTYHNSTDSAVRMIYENIQIDDASGKSIFNWDPMKELGFDAVYLPYRYAPGVMSAHTSFEWSHGNSVSYDYDGNILYSFKHIGIGKISRADGHVMWHIDRNKPKFNILSDSIPLYLQHDIQAEKDEQGNVSYTVVSSGDDEHPHCVAYQFKVEYDKNDGPVIKLLKTILPAVEIPNAGGGGNFDLEPDGNYLFNYGLFSQDSVLKSRALFEYRDEKNHVTAEYTISPSIFSYRVHKTTDWRPSRPVIIEKSGKMIADSKASVIKWYRLSGTDLHTVEYTGDGEKYAPTEEGYYCVSVKYGIGWSVSRPFKFKKAK